MLFGTILRKYTKQSYRKELLEKMIQGLSIDATQKNLFLDSLDLLDEKALESLYIKITKFVEMVEDEKLQKRWSSNQKKYTEIEELENLEKKKTQNSFNILLDSI
jgi:hypothetical protein